MSATIILKDKDGADVVFTEVSHNGNTVVYVCAGDSLLAQQRLTLTVNAKGQTNRIIAKLFDPTVEVVPSTGVPGVLWTEVGSFDLTSVLAASSDAANNFIAKFASLAGSDRVKALYTTGV